MRMTDADKAAAYRERLAAMDDQALFREAKENIWLSAYAANNPRSDYHFKCDATYDESQKRADKEIYARAHKAVGAGLGFAS